MDRFDPSTYHDTLDALIAVTTNEHHLAILRNYRRHSLMESSGQWQDIFTPELTVAEPVYRLSAGEETLVLDGLKEVTEWYAALADSPLQMLWGPISYRLMISDWGFTGWGQFGQQWDGASLIKEGYGMFKAKSRSSGFGSIDEVDPDAHYYIRENMTMLWLYDDDAKLIGEMTFDDPGSRTIEKMDPADVISLEEAARRLGPWWASEFGLDYVRGRGIEIDEADVKYPPEPALVK